MQHVFTLFLFLFTAFSGVAATITVTNANDSGAGSLRDAVLNANPTNADTITFDPTIVGGTIILNSQITIDRPLVIQGPVSTGINITTNLNSRALSISSGYDVVISWVNIFSSSSTTGGALLNSGNLTLDHCRFTGNQSLANVNSQGGGAIFNNTNANLTIDNCEFVNNIAKPNPTTTNAVTAVQGGAIYHRGDLIVANNTFFGSNSASYANGPMTNTEARGGAIFSSGGDFDLINCTLYDNSATGVDNVSEGLGGALYIGSASGMLYQCTVAFNYCTGTAGSTGGNGYAFSGILAFYGCIISDAFATTNPNLAKNTGSLLSVAGNLLDDVSGGVSLNGDEQIGSPLLSSPAYNNNAFTSTISFDCTSPAVDNGDTTNALAMDQAGQPRVFGSSIDIGAYELQTAPPVVTASSSTPQICEGDSVTVTATTPGAASYTWQSLGFGQAHTVAPATTTTYYVTATDNFGCSGSDSVTITVNPLPTPTINTATAPTYSLNGTYTSYQWYLDGSPISGATGATYTATQNGDYAVLVESADGCFGLSPTVSDSLASLSEMQAELLVSPNPFSNSLVLASSQNQDVRVISVSGEVVMQLHLTHEPTTVDTQNLKAGLYLIVSEVGGNVPLRVVKL